MVQKIVVYVSLIIGIIIIITSFYAYNTYKYNQIVKNLDNICECQDRLKYIKHSFVGANYTSGRFYFESWKNAQQRVKDSCIYPMIDNYSDCSYFGQNCVDYMEKKGINCSEFKCGVKRDIDLQNDIDNATMLYMELENTDNFTKKLEILEEIEEHKRLMAKEILYQLQHSGINAFFRDKCNN